VPVPATDGTGIWLPADPGIADPHAAAGALRTMALHQAYRARRGGAQHAAALPDPLLRDLVLPFEARGAEADIARTLPGMVPALVQLRRGALRARPPLDAFAPARRPLEALLRRMLAGPVHADAQTCASASASLAAAHDMLAAWRLAPAQRRRLGPAPLLRDWWTGEFRVGDGRALQHVDDVPGADDDDDALVARSARMTRRPDERSAGADEDRAGEPGAWMVQQDQPQEIAEDPFGLQRPVDRDEQTSPEEFGDMLSELSAARLVCSPERAREVLLSDDPPASRMVLTAHARGRDGACVRYPEWDCTSETYRGAPASDRARVDGLAHLPAAHRFT
jgi:nitric oxide reductase NorD protein